MKRKKIAVLLLLTALVSSCDYQKYNKAEQKDLQSTNEWVYGVHPDSAARQLANTYEANPELEKRTNAIREKLFGAGTISEGN